METFDFFRKYRGKDITARISILDSGIQILLTGGDLPHIGAVGVLDPDGQIAVTEFSGHKEDILCRQWLKALSDVHIMPAAMTAGIHYDDLNRSGISDVLELTDNMLHEAVRRLEAYI